MGKRRLGKLAERATNNGAEVGLTAPEVRFPAEVRELVDRLAKKTESYESRELLQLFDGNDQERVELCMYLGDLDVWDHEYYDTISQLAQILSKSYFEQFHAITHTDTELQDAARGWFRKNFLKKLKSLFVPKGRGLMVLPMAQLQVIIFFGEKLALEDIGQDTIEQSDIFHAENEFAKSIYMNIRARRAFSNCADSSVKNAKQSSAEAFESLRMMQFEHTSGKVLMEKTVILPPRKRQETRHIGATSHYMPNSSLFAAASMTEQKTIPPTPVKIQMFTSPDMYSVVDFRLHIPGVDEAVVVSLGRLSGEITYSNDEFRLHSLAHLWNNNGVYETIRAHMYTMAVEGYVNGVLTEKQEARENEHTVASEKLYAKEPDKKISEESVEVVVDESDPRQDYYDILTSLSRKELLQTLRAYGCQFVEGTIVNPSSGEAIPLVDLMAHTADEKVIRAILTKLAIDPTAIQLAHTQRVNAVSELKYMKVVHHTDRERVGAVLSQIMSNDLDGLHVKKLHLGTDMFRVRIGQYRIIFSYKNGRVSLASNPIRRRSERTYS